MPLGPGVDLLYGRRHRITGGGASARVAVLGRGDVLRLADLSRPCDLHASADAVTLLVDRARLGLPAEAVRAAAPRLTASPLYGLVLRHVTHLPALLDRVGPGPAVALLGSSAVELVRALVATVSAPDEAWLRAAAAGTLFDRIAGFVGDHRRDADLSAARLAAEHGVSVRAVYAAFAARGERLAAWVIRERLRGAHAELAERPDATVAAVAGAWGFTDARHFARRFRAEYGMSPTQWRLRRPGAGRPGASGGRW
ncbi:helix-turn-helix domain-containing protein [Dactylosporangium sp. NPDC051541]|uniref:helix-turn-helix domain-containing protein n=1 Tax=Dactylosporangium sp. NPDC051541 TaxID=3363977 RepID=UPI003791ED4E